MKKMDFKKVKTVLTIAGSDSSGGAGIQADLKTMTSYKLFGMSAITAITAQNTVGVQSSLTIEPDMLKAQLTSVCQDILPDAVKIGMVANTEQVKVIVEIIDKYLKEKPIVLDPVITSTSGFTLVPEETIEFMKKNLFGRSIVITPNLIEAGYLYKEKIDNLEKMKEAAKALGEEYKCGVLVKGGHLLNSKDDVLYYDSNLYVISGENVNNPNTHGTGCTLSSAIACELALGKNLLDAIKGGKNYLTGAIKYGLNLGSGRGPVYHMYNLKEIKNAN
ncbi:bifunctional hydroxymethylpyrimidine kinase/phosphomethylpyrimidine kinase [Peptoniphilus koenoeneniae]|nr:bifunctional hydroxymethylpyrimidine kinase/phosphomethylpyrimidine kinase [Peptoniphilus koenoeneniae]